MKIVNKYKFINFIQSTNYITIGSNAAEMSFYIILSFFPFFIFTISIIGYIPIIHLNKFIVSLQNIIPSTMFIFIYEVITSAIENRSISFLITSFILTLWTSSRAIKSFIRNTNKSYIVKETRSFIKIFILSFLFTIALLLLIFSSIILLIYGKQIGYVLFNFIGLNNLFIYVWNIIRHIVAISTVIIMLISLYKYTPNKKLTIKETIPGSIIATFSWILISFIYSYYVNNYSNYEVVYGSIAGIIVLITWIYLSAYTLFIGLEVNKRLYFIKNKDKLKNQA